MEEVFTIRNIEHTYTICLINFPALTFVTLWTRIELLLKIIFSEPIPSASQVKLNQTFPRMSSSIYSRRRLWLCKFICPAIRSQHIHYNNRRRALRWIHRLRDWLTDGLSNLCLQYLWAVAQPSTQHRMTR